MCKACPSNDSVTVQVMKSAVAVPCSIPGLVTKEILVMTFLEGEQITRLKVCITFDRCCAYFALLRFWFALAHLLTPKTLLKFLIPSCLLCMPSCLDGLANYAESLYA